MPDDGVSRAEFNALRMRLAAVERLVARQSRRRDDPDARLPAVLAMLYAFARSSPWRAGELLEDARRAAPGLWAQLDLIVGDRGDPAKRLGCWLARHVNVEADGLRLEQLRKEDGSWLYRVVVNGE